MAKGVLIDCVFSILKNGPQKIVTHAMAGEEVDPRMVLDEFLQGRGAHVGRVTQTTWVLHLRGTLFVEGRDSLVSEPGIIEAEDLGVANEGVEDVEADRVRQVIDVGHPEPVTFKGLSGEFRQKVPSFGSP